MKVQQLFEAVKGKWKIQNLRGVMKSFNDNESADARAWMTNRGDEYQKWDGLKWVATKNSPDEKARRRLAKHDDLDRRYEKQIERSNKGLDLTKDDYQRIYDVFGSAFGDSFPDGDPMDVVRDFMRRKYPQVDRFAIADVVDRALAKCGHGIEKKGRDAYMTAVWEDMMWDALHDVNTTMGEGKSLEDAIEAVGNGRTFFYVQDDKLKIADNPWSRPADRAKRLADAKKRYKNIPFALRQD